MPMSETDSATAVMQGDPTPALGSPIVALSGAQAAAHADEEYPAPAAPIVAAEDAIQAVTTTQRRSVMRTVQALLGRHLQRTGQTARAFAETSGVSYPTVLAAVNKGSLPRKPLHREALRFALDVPVAAWAAAVAASGRDAIDLGGEAPTLQQLILRAILVRGQTEQTFAEATGVPYPTILGVTRKGAIPRADSLATMTSALSLDATDVRAAIERSWAVRREGTPPVPSPESQNLAQLVANTARRNGQSLAAFARVHELPYLAVTKLVRNGVPPDETDVLDRMAQALGLDDDDFQACLDRSRQDPLPADSNGASDDVVATPLQAALRAVIQRKSLTMKAFAELSELSVLTATRLVKHGALPSRSTTHAKLARLLDLSEAEYSELLLRSRAESQTDAIGDDDFQHQETEEIPSQDGVEAALESRSAEDRELLILINRLDDRRRLALKAFLRTLV